MTTAEDVERAKLDGVRTYKSERLEDAAQVASTKATERAAKDRRILG